MATPTFAAATRYRITLSEDVATQAGERLPAVTLEAETDRPTLRAVVQRWQDGVSAIEVSSSAVVRARSAAARLEILAVN